MVSPTQQAQPQTDRRWWSLVGLCLVTALVWVTILGLVVFGDFPDGWTILGTAVIATAAVATAADVAKTRTIHSQPSAILSTKEVEVAVTKLGGNMAPVTFFRDSVKPVQPYHISPWQDEKPVKMPAPVLVTLRGDFFCVPFGGNSDAVGGEKHPSATRGRSWAQRRRAT